MIQEKEKINSNLNETLDVILAMEEKLQKANAMLKESDKLLEQSTQNNQKLTTEIEEITNLND